jgi:hypothetical protein
VAVVAIAFIVISVVFVCVVEDVVLITYIISVAVVGSFCNNVSGKEKKLCNINTCQELVD